MRVARTKRRPKNTCFNAIGAEVCAFKPNFSAPTLALQIERWYNSTAKRGVAQLGSAPVWGAGGRRFKSCLPDHLKLGWPHHPGLYIFRHLYAVNGPTACDYGAEQPPHNHREPTGRWQNGRNPLAVPHFWLRKDRRSFANLFLLYNNWRERRRQYLTTNCSPLSSLCG
jgi:hypothetical protein